MIMTCQFPRGQQEEAKLSLALIILSPLSCPPLLLMRLHPPPPVDSPGVWSKMDTDLPEIAKISKLNEGPTHKGVWRLGMILVW